MQETDYVKISYNGQECYAKKIDLEATDRSAKYITYQVPKTNADGFDTKTGYVNEINLRDEYDKYQYPYKVTENGQTRYLNSLKNIKATQEDAEKLEDVIWLNTDLTVKLPAGAIYYKVTEETVKYTQGGKKITESFQVKKSEINGKTEVTTKFADAKGNENPIFVDDHGNVQYKGVITPTAKLEGNYKPTDSLLEYNDDLTFSGNPFNLKSQKYNSFMNVGLVNYAYLDNTEQGVTTLVHDDDDEEFTYRKRAVKAPCFSCGDETAQKKFAKNKSFLYNFFGFIFHIGLGQRPLQETLLDLNF